MDTQRFSQRLMIPIGGLVLVGIFCIAKLFYVQIIHGNAYELLADRQYVSTPTSLFDRGTIYFTQKDGTHVSAATLKNGFKVTAQATNVLNQSSSLETLAPLLNTEPESLKSLLTKRKGSYVDLANQVSSEDGARIAPLKIPGISLARSTWRFYPAGDLASHVVGFMAYKGDDFTGRYGIERSYNEILARTNQRLYVNFFAEIFSDMRKFLDPKEESEGHVVTSLEPMVQQNLAKVVSDIRANWDADRVGGIIMNPQTGELYALALDNEFNLNETRKTTDVSQFNNPLVESVFEMGSIMKPIIMTIALDQGAVTPTTSYFDKGFVKVGDKTIYNFDKRGRGLATMQTVLNQSLNTGMVFTMQHMNKSAFKDQWLSFGFNKKTEIDLPAEGNNLISNINTNRDVEFANVSFGQGVAVTPIAMVRALAVLANGGYLVTPHVAETIEYPSGFTKQLDWPRTGPIIKPETQKTITDMLTTVFDNYYEGKLKLDHYTIAAKTGTAQISNPAGGYYSDRNLHTFMAYFPAKNPQFLVFLYSYYPKKGARFSSETLVPPFVELAHFLINYYNVPPDR